MSNYHPTSEMLRKFCRNELDDVMNVMVSAHLHYCAECREEAEHYDATYDESEIDEEYEKRLYGKYIPTRRPYSGAPGQHKNTLSLSLTIGTLLWLGNIAYHE